MQIEMLEEDKLGFKTVIQVFGVGGGGCNAVNRMVELGIDGVQFIGANTDVQALIEKARGIKTKIPLGQNTTGGLGAGGNPEVGREAAEEDREKILELMDEANMVFITAGMGGGTGTGAAPVIAQMAKEKNILSVAIVTTPFGFEGAPKMEIALKGIEELRKSVDTIIVIPNEALLSVVDPRAPLEEAFSQADNVLRMGVKGIADLITQPGEINVDFNDVKTIMNGVNGGGEAIMGIGTGQGEHRATDAASEALSNPLLDGRNIYGARGVLVQITGDLDFALEEYSLIMESVNEHVNTAEANVISGIAIDENLKGEIKVTVIATGFTEPVVPEAVRNTSRKETFNNYNNPAVKPAATSRPPNPLNQNNDLEQRGYRARTKKVRTKIMEENVPYISYDEQMELVGIPKQGTAFVDNTNSIDDNDLAGINNAENLYIPAISRNGKRDRSSYNR